MPALKKSLGQCMAEASASKGPRPYAVAQADDLLAEYRRRHAALLAQAAHARAYDNIAGATWFEGQAEIYERLIKQAGE